LIFKISEFADLKAGRVLLGLFYCLALGIPAASQQKNKSRKYSGLKK